MERNLEDVARQAMELAPDARAALAKKLLESLDAPEAGDHERLWVEESVLRYNEISSGQARVISADEVFAKLSSR